MKYIAQEINENYYTQRKMCIIPIYDQNILLCAENLVINVYATFVSNSLLCMLKIFLIKTF